MTATVTHERPDEVCRRLDVDPVVGLTSTEVIARRESYGPNIVCADLIDDPYVFTDAADGAEPWKPDTLSQYFGRMRKRVGLDHLDFHHPRKFMETQGQEMGYSVTKQRCAPDLASQICRLATGRVSVERTSEGATGSTLQIGATP